MLNQKPDQVSKEEYMAWRSSPATKWFVYALWAKREAVKEAIVDGKFSKEELSQAIGECMGTKTAIDYVIDFYEFTKEDLVDESLGTSSPQDYS